jgi:entericidin B
MIRLLMLIVLTVALAGCNTMHGMGKDVEKAGEAIQKATK